MSEKNRFDLLDLQKEKLTPDEQAEIYQKKPETEFEEKDKGENKEKIIPDETEYEKIEEQLLKNEE